MLFKSFIPPFIVTFMIAQFVLVMQTLWIYIDDIAGKGLGFFLFVELLAYRSVSLIPLALPLAVLISSVMVLGNLGERYELSSIKSAGVSLLRTMRPLMLFGLLATIFSYFCAVYLIPVANLQFGSRMYDITRQKPALRLEQGVFNDDFENFTIRIGNKSADGKTIKNILIYDHKEANQGRLSQIVAKDGIMSSSPDGRYFIIKLYNGHQYIETRPDGSRSHPFVRTNFKVWTKIFDLGEFQLKRTNVNLFKHNRSMLGVKELAQQADSITMRIEAAKLDLSNNITNYMSIMEKEDSVASSPTELALDSSQKQLKISLSKLDTTGPDSSFLVNKLKNAPQNRQDSIVLNKKKTTFRRNFQFIEQDINPDSLDKYVSLGETFTIQKRQGLYNKAKNMARTIKSQAESTIDRIEHLEKEKVKHIYDLHTKYSMAVACFIFMFIGAPMGAIVRKGGFGYPILVSIIFFMIFVVLTIFCRKVAESFVLPSEVAAWLPCIILFPMGLFLTTKAMNDSKLFDGGSAILNWFRKKNKPTNPANA